MLWQHRSLFSQSATCCDSTSPCPANRLHAVTAQAPVQPMGCMMLTSRRSCFSFCSLASSSCPAPEVSRCFSKLVSLT